MGQFGGDALTLNIEDLSLGEGGSWPAQDEALQQQAAGADAELQAKEAQINKLAGTLAHWRAWAAEVAARYAAYNPDVARPARRIYIGGLPQSTSDVRPPNSLSSLKLPACLSSRRSCWGWTTQRCAAVFSDWQQALTGAECRHRRSSCGSSSTISWSELGAPPPRASPS